MTEKVSRKSQTSALKTRVMDVALGHFSEDGIEKTSVDKILKGAGCSVGSFYHHFGNKEGVAEALFVHGVQDFNSAVLGALLPHDQAEQGIKGTVSCCCDWVTEKSQLAAFLLSREIKLSEQAKQELRELDRDFGKKLYDWFVPHVLSGALKKLPTSLYIPLIAGPALEHSRFWLAGRSSKAPKDVAHILADAAWQSARGPQSS